MNIGLAGYYGRGNYGDELFLDVFRSVFPEDQLTVLPDFERQTIYSAALVAEQDCIIIGGGDLVIPYAFAYQYWDDMLLSKPVYIAGVGVPTWGGYSEPAVVAMRKFFQHENVRLITARDTSSRDWIIKHLQPSAPVEFHPDIVAALQFEKRPHAGRKLGLVLRAHQADHSENLGRFLNRAVSFGYDIHKIVLGTGKTAADDEATVRNMDFPFSQVIARDSIDALTEEILQCDLVVSQKFHGCVVAMMAGIPCITLSASDKFVSFMDFFRKELFLVGNAGDPGLSRRLIDPMYEIDATDVLRIRSLARVGLLRLRDAVRHDFAP